MPKRTHHVELRRRAQMRVDIDGISLVRQSNLKRRLTSALSVGCEEFL